MLQIANCKLRIANFKKMQTANCQLAIANCQLKK